MLPVVVSFLVKVAESEKTRMEREQKFRILLIGVTGAEVASSGRDTQAALSTCREVPESSKGRCESLRGGMMSSLSRHVTNLGGSCSLRFRVDKFTGLGGRSTQLGMVRASNLHVGGRPLNIRWI